jgi:hypothetical protein
MPPHEIAAAGQPGESHHAGGGLGDGGEREEAGAIHAVPEKPELALRERKVAGTGDA